MKLEGSPSISTIFYVFLEGKLMHEYKSMKGLL